MSDLHANDHSFVKWKKMYMHMLNFEFSFISVIISKDSFERAPYRWIWYGMVSLRVVVYRVLLKKNIREEEVINCNLFNNTV